MSIPLFVLNWLFSRLFGSYADPRLSPDIVRMDFLQQLTTVDDIKSTLESIQQEENGLSRRILFNLTGSQDFYDIPDDDTAVKSSVIEYNRIVSDLQSIGSSVESSYSIRSSPD